MANDPVRHQRGESVTQYGPPIKAATLAETNATNATAWAKISVPADDMAGFVHKPSGQRTPHLVYYTNQTPQDHFINEGLYLLAQDGVCIFPSKGDWYIVLPQAGASPVTYNFNLADATALSPIMQNLVAAQGGAAQGGGGITPVTGNFDTGALSETAAAQIIRAAVTGQDLAAAAGAKNLPISADTYGFLVNNGRSPNLLESLYAIALTAAWQRSGGTTVALEAAAALTAQAYTDNRLKVDGVIRGDDGATYSVPGVRASNSAQPASALRLLVDNIARSWDILNSNYAIDFGLDAELKNSGNMAKIVYESKARGYFASLRGRRFIITGANFATITGATSFTATTPSFILVTGATKSLIIKRLTITKTVVGTSTSFTVIAKIDTANRYTSGGTARTPQNANTGSATATALATVVDSASAITATAEGGGTRTVGQKAGPLPAGSTIEFLWEDGVIVGPSASFLFYILNATAGDACYYEIEAEEAQVQ